MLNFIKNRFKFASGRPTVLDSDLSEQELEKWEIEIRRGCDVEDLADITEKCCHRFFPQARWCGLFIDEDQNGNLKNPTTSAYLPTNGIARSAGSYRAFKNSGIINEGDELFSLISPLLPHTLTKSDVANAIQGNWLPVRHETGPSLGLLLIAGEAIVENKHNMEVLRFIQNSVLSSLSHMFYNKMSHNSRILSKLYSCEDSLSADQSCILSQVMESCRAAHGFFLTYYEDDEGFTLYVADSYECKPAPSFSKEVLPHVYDYMKTKESHLLSMDTPHIRDEILHVMSHARGNSMTNGELSNKKTRHVMLNPVLRKETLLGVCVLIGNSTVFSLEEMKIARDVLNSASTILHKDIIIEHERNLRQQNEKLHQVAKNLFTHLDDLTVLLKEIMQEARTMTNSERCSVFLLENDATELVAKVFDGHITNTEEVRMPANQGIAGHVVQNGKILNIKNAYSHPLFYKGVDESTGFKTRNILCFPIKDEKDNIIGAAQLCNKIDGDFFTRVDEDVAKALSSYCCISIVHSLMYRDVLDAHNRVRLANELMMFHMHVPREEVQTLVQQKVPSMDEFGTHLKLYELGSSLPRNIPAEKTPLAVISMLEDLGLTQTFKIKSITLARFILMTRKGYRDPPYHNWSHAFSVAHFAFLVIKQLKLVTNKIISELEALAFFIAALCHDIDHRGTTNAFQVASKSVLAALYSSEGSVMERHHFSQTMCILNTEGCNIFENVTRQQYEQLLDMIRDIILSTDIAHHLRLKNAQETIAQTGFDPTNNEHKNLVMCLFMTSSDLSDQTKPWKSTKQVSKMLYKEFFSQGDLEKALGRSPIVMMDRERAQVPGLQVAFIDDIVMPCYGTLAKIFPETKPLVDMVQINREHWSRLKTLAESRRESVNSLDVFDNPEEDEVYLRPPDKQNGNTGPV